MKKRRNVNCPKIFIVGEKMVGVIAGVMESWIEKIQYR